MREDIQTLELNWWERAYDCCIALLSRATWGSERRTLLKLYEFSLTEDDSFVDVARAAELTRDEALRRQYIQHALDEARHAELFRSRAGVLLQGLRTRGHDLGPLRDRLIALRAGPIQLHAQHHPQTLFERLGERDFLGLVYLAERRGARQFRIVQRLLGSDPASSALFDTVLRDELFHMSYSRRALDRLLEQDRSTTATRLLWRIRLKRAGEAWQRLGHGMGIVSNSILFGLIYFLILGPTTLLVRRRASSGGWSRCDQGGRCGLELLSRQY